MSEKGALFLLKQPDVAATVTFTNGTNICNYTAHGMANGDPVIFTNSGGSLPAALTASKLYYAGDVTANTFTIHPTKDSGVAGTGDVALADNGSGTSSAQKMQTVAGMRTTSFVIDGETVDITTKDSSGWRDLKAGAGISKLDISAAGVFADDAGLARVRAQVLTKALDTFSIHFESGDAYWGLFQVLSAEQAGEYNGEVTYAISLSSSGVSTEIENV